MTMPRDKQHNDRSDHRTGKMRVIYIANARIPTERAHGVQIMHTCEALVEAGVNVDLIVPRRLNKLRNDPFQYYGVKKIFKIHRLPCIDLLSLEWTGRIGFWIEEHSFALAALVFIFFYECLGSTFSTKSKISKADRPILYVRGEELFSVLTSFGLGSPVFLESHMLPADMSKWIAVFRKAAGVVVINKTYEAELRCLGYDKVLWAPDAVTIEDFDIDIEKGEARRQTSLSKLGLSADTPLIMYVGHLYGWKGANILADAARFLADDAKVVFVGGLHEDLEPFRKKYLNDVFDLDHTGKDRKIIFVGQRPYKDIPLYMKAADVLVLPNTAKEAVSKWYTSPIKLFEYMASGRPIVASDLPSLREILYDESSSKDRSMNALLVAPDDPKALAQAVNNILVDHGLAMRLAARARVDVEQYSWIRRGQSILDFIKKSTK